MLDGGTSRGSGGTSMTKATDIQLKSVTCDTAQYDYRVPIKFGGRVVQDVTVANVTVEVETRDGRRGRGSGSMPMSNAWGWPSQAVPSELALQAMVQTAERLAAEANDCSEFGHPIELTHVLAPSYERVADQVTRALQLAESMPRLAQLVVASPLEAAIHDAYGKVLGANSYNLLGAEFVNTDLAQYLTDEFAGEYLDQYTLRSPKPRMPLYHLIGALDPLTDGDIAQRVDDGLPETLGEWIQADGLTHLKIKLNGDDLAWDVARVVAIERVAAEAQAARGCSQWYYSLDFNEKCANVQYVLDFLAQVR